MARDGFSVGSGAVEPGRGNALDYHAGIPLTAEER